MKLWIEQLHRCLFFCDGCVSSCGNRTAFTAGLIIWSLLQTSRTNLAVPGATPFNVPMMPIRANSVGPKVDPTVAAAVQALDVGDVTVGDPFRGAARRIVAGPFGGSAIAHSAIRAASQLLRKSSITGGSARASYCASWVWKSRSSVWRTLIHLKAQRWLSTSLWP
jgi:hypothetical protein